MNFSSSKKRYQSIDDAGPSKIDFSFIDEVEGQSRFNNDEVVETLFDYIRKKPSQFKFKTPLGKDFETAAEHALVSLELSGDPEPKNHHIKTWMEDTIHCLQVICLVFLRDIRKFSLKSSSIGNLSERFVFQQCQKIGESNLDRLGANLEEVYDLRNKLVHKQKQNASGEVRIAKIGASEKKRKFNKARDLLHFSCSELLKEYKKFYPQFKSKV